MATERERGLPEYLGLCPVEFLEFYMPIDDPEKPGALGCPSCDQELVVYQRVRKEETQVEQ